MKNKFNHCLLTMLMTVSVAVHAGAYDDLILAAERDDTAGVMTLISRGMDVNTVDPSGNTLLHLAAKNGNAQLVEDLLKRKANPLVKNKVGDTALMLAAYRGKTEAAAKLIAGGAELNPKGWTPLHYAVMAGHEDIVRLLLERNVQVDARAPNEQTALMLAARHGEYEIARLLVAAKANRALQDQYDETALTIARKYNNQDIADLIEGRPARREPLAKRAQESEEYVPPPYQMAPAQ